MAMLIVATPVWILIALAGNLKLVASLNQMDPLDRLQERESTIQSTLEEHSREIDDVQRVVQDEYNATGNKGTSLSAKLIPSPLSSPKALGIIDKRFESTREDRGDERTRRNINVSVLSNLPFGDILRAYRGSGSSERSDHPFRRTPQGHWFESD